MKITEVTAVYPQYRHVKPSWRTHLWQIVVRIDTDVGVSGWGYGGGGKAAVPIVNGHFRELLLNREMSGTDDIAGIWDDLYYASLPYGRKGIAVMALSGVDLALWDLLGKAENRTVCELLGGQRRDRVRAYATGPDATWYRDLGFDAHKITALVDGMAAPESTVVEWAEASRRALGPDALLMIDAYMTWDTAFAEQMATSLAPYRIHWFEDVLMPDDTAGLAALRPRIKPILSAGGEHEFTVHGFAELARRGALDVWQPDVTWCGGLTAAQRIIGLADDYKVPVVLHRGGEAWGLHLLAAGFGEDLAELVMGRRHADRDRIWHGEPEPFEGRLSLAEGPGFGIDVNEAMLG